MTRLVTQMSIVIAVAAVADSSINVSMAAANRPDDRYLAGYAAAVLEMRFGLPYRDLRVENGKLLLDPDALQGRDAQEVIESLRAIEGLDVDLVETSSLPRKRIGRLTIQHAPVLSCAVNGWGLGACSC